MITTVDKCEHHWEYSSTNILIDDHGNQYMLRYCPDCNTTQGGRIEAWGEISELGDEASIKPTDKK